ncbi:MAG: RNA polymerase subunit sigma-70, partial [Bacteroidetes bacterium]
MIQEGAQSHLFGILYHRYYDKVYRKCMGFARDTEAAQDMAQDVLI